MYKQNALVNMIWVPMSSWGFGFILWQKSDLALKPGHLVNFLLLLLLLQSWVIHRFIFFN